MSTVWNRDANFGQPNSALSAFNWSRITGLSVEQQIRKYIFNNAKEQADTPPTVRYPFSTGSQSDSLAEHRAEYVQQMVLSSEDRIAEFNREWDIRSREATLGGTAAAISSSVFGWFNYGRYYAMRNAIPTAVGMIRYTFPTINQGISSLGGSITSGLSNSFLSYLAGLYNSLEGMANAQLAEVKHARPTDYELLRLTGYDREGRDEIAHRQALLSSSPLTNIPRQSLIGQADILTENGNVPNGFTQFLDRLQHRHP